MGAGHAMMWPRQQGGASALLLAIMAISVNAEGPDTVLAEIFPWEEAAGDAVVPEQELEALLQSNAEEVEGRVAPHERLVQALDEIQFSPEGSMLETGGTWHKGSLVQTEAEVAAEASIELAVNTASGSGMGSADPFQEAQRRLAADEEHTGAAFAKWSDAMHTATQQADEAQDSLKAAAPAFGTDQVTANLDRDAQITDEVSHDLYSHAEEAEHDTTQQVNEAEGVEKRLADAVGSAAAAQ